VVPHRAAAIVRHAATDRLAESGHHVENDPIATAAHAATGRLGEIVRLATAVTVPIAARRVEIVPDFQTEVVGREDDRFISPDRRME
jgi:hypothetical protein